jgi:hypothetical protein
LERERKKRKKKEEESEKRRERKEFSRQLKKEIVGRKRDTQLLDNWTERRNRKRMRYIEQDTAQSNKAHHGVERSIRLLTVKDPIEGKQLKRQERKELSRCLALTMRDADDSGDGDRGCADSVGCADSAGCAG